MASSRAAIFYNIIKKAKEFQDFFYGDAKDVTFKYMDSKGNIITKTVPNLAKVTAELIANGVADKQLAERLNNYYTKSDIDTILASLNTGSNVDGIAESELTDILKDYYTKSGVDGLLTALKNELNTNINIVKSELKSELNTNIDTVKSELRTELNGNIATEKTALRNELNTNMDAMKTLAVSTANKYTDNKISIVLENTYRKGETVDESNNALNLEGRTLNELKIEIINSIIPVGTILEFMLIENGSGIRFSYDPIDNRASLQGFELFCPHSKEEYEKARQYLLSIGKPKAMGPLGIYYPSNGPGCCGWSMKNYALNSDGLGAHGWKVVDGSPTWWAAYTTTDSTFGRKPMNEPNGDYRAYAYLGIFYNDNGYIEQYNDNGANYLYTTYLCVRRKK